MIKLTQKGGGSIWVNPANIVTLEALAYEHPEAEDAIVNGSRLVLLEGSKITVSEPPDYIIHAIINL